MSALSIRLAYITTTQRERGDKMSYVTIQHTDRHITSHIKSVVLQGDTARQLAVLEGVLLAVEAIAKYTGEEITAQSVVATTQHLPLKSKA